MSFLNLNLTVFLVAGLVLFGAWVLVVYARMRRRSVCRRLLGAERLSVAQSRVSAGRRALRSVCFWVGLVFLLMALARPWWGKRLIPTPSRSRDILVAFDCSRSMLANDVAPSRLEHGKWLVRQLAGQFPGDRFGLVAFAGDAFLECPLTQDRSSLFLFLDELDTGTIPLGGTNISRALEVVEEAFEGAEGLDRAVILISDGNELQGDALKMTESLRGKDIPLFVIGLGSPTQGALIKDVDGSYVRDDQGELVSTRLDEAKLKQLAAETDGVYVRSSTTAPNLGPVARKIEQLVPDEVEEQVKKREIERYQIPLALSMGCFLLYFTMGERRRRPLATSLLFMLTVMGWPLAAQEIPTEENTEVKVLEEAVENASGEEKARLYQNLGVAYQKGNELEKAEQAYRQALIFGDEDGPAAGAAAWNLGVVQHEKARQELMKDPDAAIDTLTGAEENYRQALRSAAKAPELGRNQELLLQDKAFAEKVKEQFEKLSRMQKKAGEKAQEAAEAQQQAVNESNPKQQQQKQQNAEQKTREAAEAVRKLQNELNKLRQNPDEQKTSADQAAEAIEKAQKLQQEANRRETDPATGAQNRKEAAKALEKASELLGAGEKKPEDQKPDNQDSSDNQNQGDQGDSQKPENADQQSEQGDPQSLDRQLEQKGNPEQMGGEMKEGTFDEKQAEAVLMDMQRREKDLREALKQYRAQQMKATPVEKDW